jgi:hypothetical protein
VCAAGGCEAIFVAGAAGALWWQQMHLMAATVKPPRVDHPDAAVEHQAYKDAYKQPPPPFKDDCEKLKWQLMREKVLLAARMAWDAKWGNHYPEAIAQPNSAIRNIENKMKNAGCSCP